MQNAKQFAKNGAFRLEKIGEIYQKYLNKLNWPKLDGHHVNVMDIGCADGEVSTKILFPLLPKNCKEFVCTDVDHAMINHCKSSLNVDRKISFQHFDVTSSNLEEKFKNRFHFLFSSYCFTSVRNFPQALINCQELLKENGELLFFFMYKKNHLLTTYKKLSQMKKWHQYTSEFSDFIPHFSSDNPSFELENLLKKSGFVCTSYEFQNDCYYAATTKCHLGIYLSVDTIFSKIPNRDKFEYSKDFRKILSEETDIDFINENNLNEITNLHIPTIIFTAAKKNERI